MKAFLLHYIIFALPKLFGKSENKTDIKQFFLQYNRLISVLLVFVIVTCFYMQRLDITTDEPEYFGYNCHWIKGIPERQTFMEDSKTPITAIALVPRIIKQLANPDYKSFEGSADTYIKLGRYFMLIYALLLGIYFFLFLQNIFKLKSKILPLVLLLFDPLVMGFAPIIGSDIANGLFTLATLYYCCRYIQIPKNKYLIAASVFIGLGLTNKVSFIFVAIIITCFFLVSFFLKQAVTIKRLSQLLKKGMLCIVIILLVINSAFYFHGTGFKLKNEVFLSNTLQQVATNRFINSIPISIPFAYVQSYDLLQRSKEVGGCVNSAISTYNGVYIAGNYKSNGSIPYYYLLCMLYKIPLSIFLLTLIAGFTVYKNRKSIQLQPLHWLIIWVVIGMFLSLSFLNPFQNGIRHLLIIYPFLFIFLAIGLNKFLKENRLFPKLVIGAICVYQFISLVFYFPNLISYTNELIWNKTTAYKIFCDDNIDYGQINLPNNLNSNNTLYTKAPNKPSPGNFCIHQYQMHPCDSMGDLSVKWIRRFKPVGNYKYSILLFHITEDDIKKERF